MELATTTFERRLGELRTRFVQAMPARVEAIEKTLRDCMAKRTPEAATALERHFHSLAGTAGTYGLLDVEAAAREGEEASMARDDGRLTAAVDRLRAAAGIDSPGVIRIRPDAAGRPAWSDHDLVCTHDLQGRVLSVSPHVVEALGIPSSILCGMAIQTLLPPQYAARFDSYMQALMEEGYATGMMTVLTRAGERLVWEYRNTLVMEDGSAGFVRGVARDVTKREEAFQAVRRSEEHFRSIIENASDIIAIIEPDGQVRYQSPSVERVLGHPPKALVGMPFVELVHPEDVDRAEEFLAAQIADPAEVRSIELRKRHSNGSWRSFEILARNLVKEGVVSAIVTNARDVTERRLLEAQLIQANRLASLGRLAATVAHEFNNVLMGMQPFAELMQRPGAAPAVIARGASHIANSIQRGKRIALDILRFTQPAEPVTATMSLADWWADFLPEAEGIVGNSIRIVSDVPEGLFVVADRGQLSQVLANLVANARDAMPGGGHLTVRTTEPPAGALFPFGVVAHPEWFVQISVGDTGCGISPQAMNSVFEPLFTTKQNGGTGLGLAVAHQVLTQHRGYIFVESEPRLGTTFHLFLPKGAPPIPMERGEAVERRAIQARKLLIIDDEPLIVEGVRVLMESEGFEVESIGRGAGAVDAVTRFRPDFVLLDFGLPDMDGMEVCSRIRKMDPQLAVIFATGHGDRRVLFDGLRDSRTRFLQKPFEVSLLLEMMAELDRSDR
jgi:PAS domain S-box-containing protein